MLFLEKHWKDKEFCFFVLKTKKGLWIHYDGTPFFWKEKQELKASKESQKKKKKFIQSPMPGRIQKIFIKEGDKVKKGQSLLSLSAMKIEYSFKAEGEAMIEMIFCKEEESVSLNQNLIKIKYTDPI